MAENAKSDNTHDGRYTHKTAASPGMGAPKPEFSAYPKWVYPDGAGKPGVVVQTPDEEDEVLGTHKRGKPAKPSDGGFVRLALLVLMAVVAFVLLALPARAQTVLNRTTLSAAVVQPSQGAPANLVSLTSLSNVAVNDMLWVDLELMQIVAPLPTSGTTVQVRRGIAGTTPSAHANASTVTTGPGNRFHPQDPPSGTCSVSSPGGQQYSPWINTSNGNVWVCRTGGTWNGTNIRALTYNSTQTGTP